MKAYLNIGTNIGNRLSNLEEAVAVLEYLTGSRARVSQVVESEAWGYKSANRYLNISVEIEWDGTPIGLLDAAQRVERQMGSGAHRDSAGGYVDRLIDVDIIEIEGVEMRSERLTLPHPRAHERDFVVSTMQTLGRAWF